VPQKADETACGSGHIMWDLFNRAQVILGKLYSTSYWRVAPENFGLQKDKKCNTFACHTCNEMRLCALGIRKKEVGNTKG
jgi:hypothetical protein